MSNRIPPSNAVLPLRRAVAFQHGDAIYAATLTGDLTLTRSLAQVLHLSANGTSRVVTLPAPGDDFIGHPYALTNTGLAVNLYLKTSAGVLLTVVYPGDQVTVMHGASDYQVVQGWAVGKPLGLSSALKSGRYRLSWTAGSRGHPGLNGDIASATEATREPVDPNFEVLGTNATSALCTYYAEGGILFTTAGADGDEMILAPHLDTKQSGWTGVTWGTDQETVWECFVMSAANITNAIIWAGLKLTSTEVTATDNDQVFFRYEDDVIAGEWQAIDSIGGTDTATDTNVAVATATRYHLQIVIDQARLARFYVNGALVKTSAALTTATDLIPYIGVAADGAAAAKSLRIFGQTIERNTA